MTLLLYVRGITIVSLLAVVVVVSRRHWRALPGRLAIALSVCVMAYVAAPNAMAGGRSTIIANIILIGAITNPAMVWLLAMALFRDPFRLRWPHIVAAAGATAVRVAFANDVLHAVAPHWPVTPIVDAVLPNAVALALVALAIIESQRGSRHDLIEPRRKLRRGFLAVIAVYTALVLVVETFLGDQMAPLEIEVVNQLAMTSIAVAAAIGIHRHGAILLGPQATVKKPAQADELRQKLDAWLESEGFLESEVSIADLAKQLGTQEHRLRRLLNQELGFRNFRDFLHQHRIAEACRRLVNDPQQPILNLSLDLGYASLATFNRAFKKVAGVSPTDYRARHGRKEIPENA